MRIRLSKKSLKALNAINSNQQSAVSKETPVK